MARETKVGLLAGLAFIICFAVILTNRGANGPPGLTNSFLPNSPTEPQKLANRSQPGATRAKTAPAKQDQVVQNVPVTRPEPPGTALTSSIAPPATGAQVPMPSEPMPVGGAAQQPPPAGIPVLTNEELARDLASRTQPQNAVQPAPSTYGGQVTITGSGAIDPNRPATTEGINPASAKSPPVPGVSYTVKPSDTLSSIAASHYGTKSHKAVQAIFEANRGVLPDLNHLKTGMVLAIPNATGAVQLASSTPSSPLARETTAPARPAVAHKSMGNSPAEKKTAEKKADKKPNVSEAARPATTPKNFRWYQVQKNDRYASIAREQLGDANRWREVFEMNKDKFPNPEQIREGVRIKLPVAAVASGKEKRN